LLSPEVIAVFLQVVLIDVVLAGDNAMVIGLAAARLPAQLRGRAILIGIGAATLLRIVLASIAVYLLQIPGILLVGGLLLVWVAWKMGSDLLHQHHAAAVGPEVAADGGRGAFSAAVWQIVIADVSMSVDNVLAVAGAAREHPVVLIVGLVLSVALMGLAATLIARLLERFRWLAWLGLAAIVYVALDMVWRGTPQVWDLVMATTG
jgi:YjbE family integral membrane protein